MSDKEKELFPDETMPRVERKRQTKRTVKVRRYGRISDGKQVCLSENGEEAFLVDVDRIKGKALFPLTIDGKVESVYNWKDDLHKLTGEIVDTTYLALLRLGKTQKSEITAEDRAYISRTIVAILDKLN